MVEYSTRSAAEQSHLEKHLENCASCSAFFTTIQKQQYVFDQVKNWNPEIKDPVVFTDQIMEALPKQGFQTEKKEINLAALFSWTPLQTALAVSSLVLALTFAIEYTRTMQPIQNQHSVINGVALTSDHEELINAKRSRTARFSLEKIIHQENTFAFSK